VNVLAAREKAQQAVRRLLLAYSGVFLAVVSLAMLTPHVLGLGAGSPLAVLVCCVMPVVISLDKVISLRSDAGAQIVRGLGGRELNHETAALPEKRFLNVIEEVCIAAGLEPPQAYVLDGEVGINAFVAGNSQSDSVIAVTEGLLVQLNREELQAVVAQEVGHMVSGDQAINTWLLGSFEGLTRVTTGMLWTYQGLSRLLKDREAGAVLAVLAVLLLMGLSLAPGWVMALMSAGFGWLLASGMKAAAVRRMELLADAYSVQFTRNPQALASALASMNRVGARISRVGADRVGHMLLGNTTVSNYWGRMVRTHTSIEERIERIAPGYVPAALNSADEQGAHSP
jgi:Zn-dependent protease with chaperone function